MVYAIMGLIRSFFSPIGLICVCLPSYAGSLWQTDNQNAYEWYQKKHYRKASELFNDMEWKATALYRNHQYQQAAKIFSEMNTANGWYNAGNAFAKQGDYVHALQAYQKALKIEPTHADAEFNKKIVEKLLEQQKQDKSQEQKQDKSQEQKQDKSQEQKQDKSQEQKQDKSQEQKQDKSQEQKQDKSQEQKQDKSQEQKQDKQLSQWLKLIEDDPEGLLRQKFLRDYRRQMDRDK